MIRGPKPKSIEEKKQTGTYRASRDVLHPIETSANPPIKPDYLTPAAETVWDEELDRVVQAGTTELDSSLFADYCSLFAQTRNLFQTGQTPKGNQLTELRKMRELLGIGGSPSRSRRGAPAAQDPLNPFTALFGG